MFTVLFLIIIIVVIIQTELLWPEAMREAASPADVVLLKWVGVCFVGAGAGGAADASVVRVDAESGLNHHHAVMILVAAWRICGGKEKRKNWRSKASLTRLSPSSLHPTDRQTYLSQLNMAVCCILLGSLGSSSGRSGHWGQCCQQDIAPHEHGSHRCRNVNTEVTETGCRLYIM